MSVKLFVRNMMTNISYNLNKYIHYKAVYKLFEVVYLYLHIIIALYLMDRKMEISMTGMKSYSTFVRILVTAVHFTDINWISNNVYSK